MLQKLISISIVTRQAMEKSFVKACKKTNENKIGDT